MTAGSLSTTSIGSLPHTEVSQAIALAFRLDIPCLPTLPRRAASELMVPQGLLGLPGLTVDEAGDCTLDVETWRGRRLAFQKTLTCAIDGAGQASPLALAEEACAAWNPFLWELRARKTPFAKIQLVGPLTACRAVELSDGRMLAAELPIANQVFQLLVARAFAMIRAVQECGARPIFFFDEPGLTGLPLGAARHLMGLQELRVAILALRRTGALVGLHCCGETQWERLLPLGLDLLALDSATSLSSLLGQQDELAAFSAAGGRLVLGIIPTSGKAHAPTAALAEQLVESFAARDNLALLRSALLSPACGLARHTVAEAEVALEALREVQSKLAHRPALA